MKTISVADAIVLLQSDGGLGGESYAVVADGKPPATLSPAVVADANIPEPLKRIGFLPDLVVPDDIKTPYAADIEGMFYGNG